MKHLALGAALLLLPASSYSERVILSPIGSAVAVRVLETSDERVVLEYEIGAFEREWVELGGESYAVLSLPGESPIEERGYPDLPHVCRSVVVADAGRMEVSVMSSEFVEYEGMRVVPSKGVLERTVDPATVPYEFGSVYGEGGWWPRELAWGREPYILRDFRGVCVVVQPMQYDAGTGLLRVYTRMVVEVRNAGPGGVNELEVEHRERMNGEFAKIYGRQFLNFESTRYVPVSEVGEMLIITNDAFATDLAPLVAWKNQMGIETSLVLLSSIGADSASVRGAIRSFYDSTDLAFVLLVGDAAQMPFPTTSGAAADPTLALVAGDDSYPDLLIGRFSASTSYQARTQVERTIEYERDPEAGASWYEAAAGIASDGGPGDDDELDSEHMDVIRDRLLGFGYEEMDRIYDPAATAEQVSAALNAGRGLVAYCGHGSRTSWGTTGFSNAHIAALVNHDRLPFLFNVACLNGEFTSGTCMAEQWLRSTHAGSPTGAIAVYASSLNQTWDPPMAAEDESIDLLVRREKRTFGGLCFGGACRMMDEYGFSGEQMFASWHVFGDPSLQVRTGAPAPLTALHPFEIWRSATYLLVRVDGAEGALCGLSNRDSFVGSALAGPDGSARIPIETSLEIGDALTLTVTAPAGETYVGEIHVLAAPACEVVPQAIEATVPAGEGRTIDLEVQNAGDPGSILSYSIRACPVAGKSLAGSTLYASLSEFEPGESYEIRFAVLNASDDWECLKGASLDFPSGVVVTGSTDFTVVGQTRKLTANGETGSGAEVTWSVPGLWGEVYPGEVAEAVVFVTALPDFLRDMELEWELAGDGWGAPPHVLYGEIEIPLVGPSFHLHAPNGGETYLPGDVVPVLWSSSDRRTAVDISLSVDAGETWSAVAESADNDGLYEWRVPDSPSDRCLLRVGAEDGAWFDASDAEFRVAEPLTWLSATPAAGELDAGKAETVRLDVDATGLECGDYSISLLLASNAGPPVVVPFSLRVAGSIVDSTLSTIEANDPRVLSPGADADSVLRIVVTARDASGHGIPGLEAGSVVVRATGTPIGTGDVFFCETRGPETVLSSTEPTDGEGRVFFEVNRVGGCGTIALRAEIAGVEIADSAAALFTSPDMNGDGSLGFPDVFVYAPLLQMGYGFCGNLDGDPNDVVDFSDTARLVRFLLGDSSCP